MRATKIVLAGMLLSCINASSWAMQFKTNIDITIDSASNNKNITFISMDPETWSQKLIGLYKSGDSLALHLTVNS